MSKYMTPEQAKGILRALIAAIGGGAVARGWITAENWDWVFGGMAIAVPSVWSWFKNRPQENG